MAPRSALVGLSYTADSDSEDEMARGELDALPTPDSNTENRAPTRKPRGKAAQTGKTAKATKLAAKAKPAARRTSRSSILAVKKQNAAVTKKAVARGGRKALAERQNANMSDTEEVDEFAGEDIVAEPVEEAKPTRRGRPAKGKAKDEGVAEVPQKKTRKTVAVALAPATKDVAKGKVATKGRATKHAPSPEPEPKMAIPETQPDPEPMDIEESIEVEEVPKSMPPLSRPSRRHATQPRAPTKQPMSAPRRAGSVSDSERDPAYRRKLGDVTKKLEAITLKYNNLKELASSGKELNFEQLRRRTDQTAKDQDAVIKALKQQIAEIQSQTGELAFMRNQITKLEKENARLTSETKSLSMSLTSAQNENKTLSTKLAAARSSAPPEPKTVPGSAAKPRSTVVLPGAAEAAKESQTRLQKVELYSDLTNLLICGVKKGEEYEEVYDCVQTGRNALHFYLSVINDSHGSYDDTEFVYNPQFDQSRDQALLDLLPDYLTEEISFPRSQAAKFYMKVVDCMSKRIELEE
ncbi:hypothetical protein CC78DRAFT_323281 [Lojkania enalia]|uniref:Monopolin complex subunit Csm1/Pcs1 C-terminal domain-containing protein n=1 Tax=Lojkania enalia TaxID=147567 RepID=A0A9P4K748_9PLEO|nr:hypothetical protein CC78DRAFT_323281 [Didymosphaeria enalia]